MEYIKEEDEYLEVIFESWGIRKIILYKTCLNDIIDILKRREK